VAKQAKLLFSFLLIISLLDMCFFPATGEAETEKGDSKVKSIYLSLSENGNPISPEEIIFLKRGDKFTTALWPYMSCENGKVYDLLGCPDVEWITSDPQVVTVNNGITREDYYTDNNGITRSNFVYTQPTLHGVGEGEADVTAVYKGLTCTVKVKIIIVTDLTISFDKDKSHGTVKMEDPNTIVLGKGSEVEMLLTAKYSNDKSQGVWASFAEWSSENGQVALIAKGGNMRTRGNQVYMPGTRIIGIQEGTTTVTTSLDGVSTQINVKVIPEKEFENVLPKEPDNIPLEPQITVKINGIVQTYDQPPVLRNGRTLVPLRGIFEALGAIVNWDAA